MQEELDATIGALNNYDARKLKYNEGKTKLLIKAKNFYDGREMVINAFKNKIFLMTPSSFSSDDDDISSGRTSPRSLDAAEAQKNIQKG